jgi:hypothetical protein
MQCVKSFLEKKSVYHIGDEPSRHGILSVIQYNGDSSMSRLKSGK